MLLHRAEPSLPQTISKEESKAGASCGQPGSQGEQGETGAWLCAQLLLRSSQIRILRIRRPSWAGRAGVGRGRQCYSDALSSSETSPPEQEGSLPVSLRESETNGTQGFWVVIF